MNGHVTYIPPHLPFLDTLAHDLIARLGDDPFALADHRILLPTRRAVRQLIDTLLDLRNGQPLILPQLSAIGDVDDEELMILVAGACGEMPDVRPPISNTARQILLSSLVQARSPHMDYAQIAGLTHALITLMDQVQNERLSWDGLQALVPDQFAQHWQQTLSFLEIIRIHWPQILVEQGVSEPCHRRNQLLALLANHWQQHPPSTPVIIAGVTGSLPAVADLMKVVQNLEHGEIIFSGFDERMTPQMWDAIDHQHPQYELRQTLARMEQTPDMLRPWHHLPAAPTPRAWLWHQIMLPAPAAITWPDLKNITHADMLRQVRDDLHNLHLVEAEDTEVEATAIALLTKRALQISDNKIAIVTPDRALARRIVQCCRSLDIQVNDSGGELASETSPGLFLLQILAAVQGQLHPIDILVLLRHPLTDRAQYPDRFTDLIDQFGMRGFRPRPEPDAFIRDIEARIPPGVTTDRSPLSSLIRTLQPLMQTAARPLAEWVHDHVAVAEQIGTRDERGLPKIWADEYGTACAKLMADLLQMDTETILSFTDYVALIRHHLESLRVHVPRQDHPRVALLGVYEARLTTADVVILAGMNEDIWPGESSIDPWFSRAMRADFGLPSAEAQVGRIAHDLVQLAQAPQVILTRTRLNNGVMSTPSRWWQRLHTVLHGLGFDPINLHDTEIEELARYNQEPTAYLPPLARPNPYPPLDLRPTIISASTFENLIYDPYVVYAQRILDLKRLEDIDVEPSGKDIGNVIHRTLEKFVAAHPDVLTDQDTHDLYDQLDLTLNEMIPDRRWQKLLAPKIKQSLRQFLFQDRDWRETGARPWRLEDTWTTHVNIKDTDFTLHARLDRMDRLQNGKVAIFDYKTGVVPSYTSVEIGEKPQIPFQIYVTERGKNQANDQGITIDTAGFWDIKSTKSKMNVWQDASKRTVSALHDLIEKLVPLVLAPYLDPEQGYPSDPLTRPNRMSNDYDYLARIKDWQANNNDESDDMREDQAS
jgi:ATP-dependent helicase/nuclease subunit B